MNAAEAFAAKLRLNAFAGLALVGAGFPAVLVFNDFQRPMGFVFWSSFILAAAAALGLSLYLLFDAMLFRLFAWHKSEAAGGKAVDDFLVKSGLCKTPDVNRTLDERIAGTARLLNFQRAALLVFLALFVSMAAA